MSNLPSITSALFEPKWQCEFGEDGIYAPKDLENRSPHPRRAPRRVRHALSGTYQQVVKYDVAELDFVCFSKLPIEIRRPIPWQWPISRKSKRWSSLMSCFWANLEINLFAYGDNHLLDTARFVSRKRLAHHPAWAKRTRFLEDSVQAYTGCLFRKDGVIDRLVKMEAKHPLAYGRLTLTISTDLPEGRMRDPLRTYIVSHQCVCRVQHDDRHSPIAEPLRSISCTCLRLTLRQFLRWDDMEKSIEDMVYY